MANEFGLSDNGNFYRVASMDRSWVNLECSGCTLTGRVTSYDPIKEHLIFDTAVTMGYSPSGKKRNCLMQRDFNVDLINVHPILTSRTTIEEAKARVRCYNSEFKAKSPELFLDDEREIIGEIIPVSS